MLNNLPMNNCYECSTPIPSDRQYCVRCEAEDDNSVQLALPTIPQLGKLNYGEPVS